MQLQLYKVSHWLLAPEQILKQTLRISFSWKSCENVLKNPWTFFQGHENSDFGFHGAKLSHEIFNSYFHEPWKVNKAINTDFHGSGKSHMFYSDTFHDPWKGNYSLACISWVMKVLMANEIPMKAQLKSHESVQLTLAQK